MGRGNSYKPNKTPMLNVLQQTDCGERSMVERERARPPDKVPVNYD